MKNIFLLMLLFTGMVKAQIVNIPDANFKARLFAANSSIFIAQNVSGQNMNIDANSDGEIQETEALAVYALNIQSSNITDLTGLLSFSNLRQLYTNNNPGLGNFEYSNLTNLVSLQCANTNMTVLNVSNLSNLVGLLCSGNQLTQLEVGNLTNLNSLICSGNQLTQLDVNNLVNLGELNCGNNLLTQLDVIGNTSLRALNCSYNLLTTINISGSINLYQLDCQHNQLSSIDFSGFTSLPVCNLNDNLLTDLTFDSLTQISYFDISNNLFQDLDLSRVHYVYNVEDSVEAYALYTGNPLRTLNMKNGIVDGMPAYDALNDINTWEFICGDDLSYEISLIQINRPGVVVNSYCSFVPGGDYNAIVGNIKYDIDNNGCDTSDINFPNIRIDINGDSIQGAAYTNITGYYTFYTQAGNFQITPSIENPTWFSLSPITATIPFADNNNNAATQDFCISPNGFHPDVEVVISPVFFARPGFDATYQITYRNKGNQTFSEGLVGMQYNDAVLDFVSTSQATFSQAVGNINWQYTNLLPFESRTITVTLNVNSPTETPAVNIGDTLNFVVSTFPLEADENPLDNTFEYIQTVVGSYDPNDITCLEGDVVAPSEIGNYLHYAINFENTGTFPAENVVVKTEVDDAKFDIGSLQLMNSNFPVDARITGNKVEFIFKNIQLPIGGHGHILLKIKTNATLVVGDAVANRADIFFDYNFPIDTGMANTVFQTLSNADFEIDNSVLVAPNPASNEVTIKADNNIISIQLFDVQGRILQTSLVEEMESKLDISSHDKGLYFIKIKTDKGSNVQKLLKN
jgi:hypothetical protein